MKKRKSTAKAWELPTDRMPTEHEEQKDVVRWFRRRFPSVRIFAIPNGGGRSKSEALKLVQEGVSKGVPDLQVPAFRLWIEMKTQKKGQVKPEQKDWHEYLRSIGHIVIVPKGSADCLRMILELEKKGRIPAAFVTEGKQE